MKTTNLTRTARLSARFGAAALLLAALLARAPGALAQTTYSRDDGTAESALGFGYAQDYCWLEWFDAVGGTDTISAVRAYIPASTPSGTPIRVCVWEDPNDDGDPNDGVLVAQSATTVQHGGPNAFVRYALPVPAQVHGRFFVGAVLTEDGTMSPAALDYSVYQHVSWFSFASPGTFDTVHLGSGFNFPLTHIETIGAGIHGAFMLRAEGGTVPTTYCTAQINSQGCLPSISFVGQPSASSAQPFLIRATNVLGNVNGMLLYGTNGPAAVPFGGGTLCVSGPVRRTAVQSSGGVGPFPNCTGQLAYDFNARIRSGADPALVQGATVWAQFYSRDGGAAPPNATNLTDAVRFTIAP